MAAALCLLLSSGPAAGSSSAEIQSAVKKIEKQRRFLLMSAIASGAVGGTLLRTQCNPTSKPKPVKTDKKLDQAVAEVKQAPAPASVETDEYWQRVRRRAFEKAGIPASL